MSEISEKALQAFGDVIAQYGPGPYRPSPDFMKALAAFQDALYAELRQKVNHLAPIDFDPAFNNGCVATLCAVLALLEPKPKPLCKHCGLIQSQHNPSGKCPVQPQPTSFEPEIVAARGKS